MTLTELKAILDTTGLPVAYHHFPEGEGVPAPFIVYLVSGTENFAADGIVYHRGDDIDIELYTDTKDLTTEGTLETALANAGIYWDASDEYIDDEKLYLKRYTITL